MDFKVTNFREIWIWRVKSVEKELEDMCRLRSHRNGQNHFVRTQKNLRFFVSFLWKRNIFETEKARDFLAIQAPFNFWLVHFFLASTQHISPASRYESSLFSGRGEFWSFIIVLFFQMKEIDGGTLVYVIKWNIYKNYKLINFHFGDETRGETGTNEWRLKRFINVYCTSEYSL